MPLCISMNYISILNYIHTMKYIFPSGLPRGFHLFQRNHLFSHCPIYQGTKLPTHPSPDNFSPAKKWSGPWWCSSQPRCSRRHGWGTGRQNLARSECLSWATCSASDHTPWPASRRKSLVGSGWRARQHRCQQWSEMAPTTARPSTKPFHSEEDGQSWWKGTHKTEGRAEGSALNEPGWVTESHRWTELLDFNKPSTGWEKQLGLGTHTAMLNKGFIQGKV